MTTARSARGSPPSSAAKNGQRSGQRTSSFATVACNFGSPSRNTPCLLQCFRLSSNPGPRRLAERTEDRGRVRIGPRQYLAGRVMGRVLAHRGGTIFDERSTSNTCSSIHEVRCETGSATTKSAPGTVALGQIDSRRSRRRLAPRYRHRTPRSSCLLPLAIPCGKLEISPKSALSRANLQPLSRSAS